MENKLLKFDFISILFLVCIVTLGVAIAAQVGHHYFPNDSMSSRELLGLKFSTVALVLTTTGMTIELLRRRKKETEA